MLEYSKTKIVPVCVLNATVVIPNGICIEPILSILAVSVFHWYLLRLYVFQTVFVEYNITYTHVYVIKRMYIQPLIPCKNERNDLRFISNIYGY